MAESHEPIHDHDRKMLEEYSSSCPQQDFMSSTSLTGLISIKSFDLNVFCGGIDKQS